MEAIESLMFEHRVLERALAALETFASQLSEGSAAECAELARFVVFLEGFADRQHHSKEEKLLFPRMNQGGLTTESGPLAVMLHEHETLRAMLRSLTTFTTKDGWSAREIDEIGATIGRFSVMTRGHIVREDSFFFPLAEERLPVEALVALGIEFDRHAAANSVDEKALAMLGAELITRWLADLECAVVGCSSGGCTGGCASQN